VTKLAEGVGVRLNGRVQIVEKAGDKKRNVAVMVKGLLSFATEKLREGDSFRGRESEQTVQ